MPRESTPESLFDPSAGELTSGTIVDSQDDPSDTATVTPSGRGVADEHSAGLLRTGRQRWQFVYTVGVAFAIVVLQMAQGILLARLLGAVGRGEYAVSDLVCSDDVVHRPAWRTRSDLPLRSRFDE